MKSIRYFLWLLTVIFYSYYIVFGHRQYPYNIPVDLHLLKTFRNFYSLYFLGEISGKYFTLLDL